MTPPNSINEEMFEFEKEEKCYNLDEFLIEVLGAEKLAQEFKVWAVGKSDITFPEVPAKWNLRHGKLFLIEEDGTIAKDVAKMIQIWRKEDQDANQ